MSTKGRPSPRWVFAATLVVVAEAVMAAAPVAGEEPLVTDRPDFTESPNAVAVGIVQVEAGTTYAESADGSDAATFGEVLVRWGVLGRFEMRFVLPTYMWANGANGESTAFVDSGVGVKYQITAGGGRGVMKAMEAGVIVATTVPTGGPEFSSPSWQPAAVVAAGWDLGPVIGLGVNVGVGRPADDSDRYTTVWASAAFSIGWTEELSVFLELIGFNREEARGPNTATFQTGMAYLLSPDLQLDFRAGRRLTDRGANILVGAGISWRLGG